MMISSPNKGFSQAQGSAHFHSNCFALPPGQLSADFHHGTKRPASCREDLERGWQGVHHDLRYVSHEGSGSDESSSEPYGARVKRRRTLLPGASDANDNGMNYGSFVKGTRISSSNRPARASSRPPVKAGWYEGAVDAAGNRHGRGITKHDDGTEYEGSYCNDLMDGTDGRYHFIVKKHLVPNPHNNGSHLSREVKTCFEGSFRNDFPHGVGMLVNKTVDRSPPAPGSAFSDDVRNVEVVYDVAVHNGDNAGKAMGEGVRVVYNADGRGEPTMDCFRLYQGQNTNVRIAPAYATWVFQAMGVEFPKPPLSF